MIAPTNTDIVPPLDPQAVTERYQQTAAEASAALAHMDTALTAAEAGLAIARYHHAHRLTHLATADCVASEPVPAARC